MRVIIGIAATALLAAGCDSGSEEAAQPQQSIRVRSAEQEQLHTLNDLNRAIALKRAIYASGYRCQRVTDSGFVAEYKNLDMWTASCDDGRKWAIFAGPDGSAQVRDCKDVAEFGLPGCTIEGKTEQAAAAG